MPSPLYIWLTDIQEERWSAVVYEELASMQSAAEQVSRVLFHSGAKFLLGDINTLMSSAPFCIGDNFFARDLQHDGGHDSWREEELVYIPRHKQAKTTIHCLPPMPVTQGQTPAAFSMYGDVWIGYLGDVNRRRRRVGVVKKICRFPASTASH
jgi:hypothetical protein